MDDFRSVKERQSKEAQVPKKKLDDDDGLGAADDDDLGVANYEKAPRRVEKVRGLG